MPRSLSDLLAVYVLAREAGPAFCGPEGLVCSLPVVPLFETIEDLQNGPEILQAFLPPPEKQQARPILRQAARAYRALANAQGCPSAGPPCALAQAGVGLSETGIPKTGPLAPA